MARRQHLTLTVALALVLFFAFSYLFTSSPTATPRSNYDVHHEKHEGPAQAQEPSHPPATEPGFSIDVDSIPTASLDGDSIAPKLENATLKAELGRATWKFLHTMMARFPEEPTADDRKTLESFMHLFGRLYPCGECAGHFRELMAKYPPQTSSRNAAAGWLCFAHNLVNERLEKPVFDCNNIGDFYDCGCGDDDSKKKETVGNEDDLELELAKE